MDNASPVAAIHHEVQSPFEARFDWGEAGLRALAPAVAVAVIVDVLSFGTAVAVAIGRGAAVRPCPWRGRAARALARSWDAALAVPRPEVDPDRPFSLSPPTLRALGPGDRLVLPSPNGSRLCVLAADAVPHVLAGCLRNATAVARTARALAGGGPIAVVAAGERRRGAERTLRPAVEDLIGAGAVLAALGSAAPSPEAAAAIAAFRAAAGDLSSFLAACASGRELIAAGFPEDVVIAAELDADALAPVLRDGILSSR